MKTKCSVWGTGSWSNNRVLLWLGDDALAGTTRTANQRRRGELLGFLILRSSDGWLKRAKTGNFAGEDRRKARFISAK